jgi:hypothetical protein
LFRKIFANTKIPNLFWIKFEYEQKLILSLAKPENPEIKSFCIALMDTLQMGKHQLNELYAQNLKMDLYGLKHSKTYIIINLDKLAAHI